jgi:uncharacterized protein (DUF2236 family)
MSASARTAGYFAPDSMIRRITREAVLMLGGGRALLLQAAHPLAVAGVAEHSDYEESPWARLERTMTALWTVVYGTREEGDRVGAHVRAMHDHVHGRIAVDMGPFPAGTPYRADDPELLMWVHASVLDTALLMYRNYVGPLTVDEMESYYHEMKELARILVGLRHSDQPDTLADFRAYMDERLASDEICVTDTARDVVDVVIHPAVPLPLRPAFEAINQITAGFLPRRLRREYGFSWDPARKALLAASAQYVRRVVLPLTPGLVRAIGPARRAERHLRVAA